ncbi:putative monogalactosyldiacylglycerol synthase 3, chloroplastic [Curcuma longa]|uniref:putative monogalactosyldiacylglycerol synthase 3, chloroplastic n=1 Tax=Curcuma longa TaxID=136217 RepID=UPI003D9F29F7
MKDIIENFGVGDKESLPSMVFVKDLFMEHAGWPLNNMESSYKFMVKHVQLWRMAFHGTSPRWIPNLYLAAIASFYTKYGALLYSFISNSTADIAIPNQKVEVGLKKYKPDIIISVHPLMQHIPLLVLKWQNLQNKVVFVTVITDLNTCHPTCFHSDVNRCYCPSEEVAKRAALDGLQPSQIHVSGLPIRPSFCRAVLVKDELRKELEMDSSLYLSMMAFELYGMLAGNASPVQKATESIQEFKACWSKPVRSK